MGKVVIIGIIDAMTDHQRQQMTVIDSIEKQVNTNAVSFTTVSPVLDLENDTRICLTSVHFPERSLLEKIQKQIIAPLKEIAPELFYYPAESLHMTIKNIRIINNPPSFTESDINNAETLFKKVIPQHNCFNVYFYRLFLFQNNLALFGTTDPELDALIFSLDKGLKTINLSDDKIYTNDKFFFSNMTLARFQNASEDFKKKVSELSNTITFEPYVVDSVTLLTANAVFLKRHTIKTFSLQAA